MEIDLSQLPVPDWGLHCPKCRYPLQGLPAHRCPECGSDFDVADLVGSWTRLRPPWYTGSERPLPDFGLRCAGCGAKLAGAAEHFCPGCGRTFDPLARRPATEWFMVDTALCGDLPIPAVQVLFLNEHVPHIPVAERTVSEIYGGHNLLFSRLRVPSEFYFDVLFLLQRTRREMAAVRAAGEAANWVCRGCGEENPGNFELCWSCQGPRPAAP